MSAAIPPTKPAAKLCGANSQLAKMLRAGQFAVAAEVSPPIGPNPEAVKKHIDMLKGYADAFNVTDNQSAMVHMSSLAVSIMLKQAGMDPVVQFTCRDRNRLGLQGDLLGAAGFGITTVLAFVVARSIWKWSLPVSVALFGVFLLVDVGFFAANLIKIVDGGWFPLAFGLVVFMLMLTWKRGRQLLQSRLETDSIPLDVFIASASLGCTTVPGTAIFLTTEPSTVPHALLHSMKHYKSLHDRIVLLNAVTLDVPHVPPAQRVAVDAINTQFYKVKVFFGFMDEPDLPEALEWCAEQGLRLDMMDTSFFLGRETLIPKVDSEMAFWRERLFITMVRNARGAADYFGLPSNRVVELGAQVVL